MSSEAGTRPGVRARGGGGQDRIGGGGLGGGRGDRVLPGIDGVGAIRRIRALDPPLGRIAIIGGSGRGDDEAASRAAGADAFLVKPVSPRTLATVLLESTRRGAAAT